VLNSVPRLSGRIWPAVGDRAYFWLLLALLGPVPLFSFGFEGLLHGWTRPGNAVFAVVPPLACIVFLRALSQLPPAVNVGATRWPGVIGAVSAISIAIVGNLAWLDDLVILAIIVWLASLVVIWFGLGRATAFWLPFGMLLLILPRPRFVFDPVISACQTLSFKIGAAISSVFGSDIRLQGQLLTAGTGEVRLSSVAASLDEMLAVFLLAMLFAAFSGRPLWARILPLILALPVTIVVAGVRIGLFGAAADHLGTSEADRLLAIFGGPVLVGLGALVAIAGAHVLSRHRRAETSARGTEAVAAVRNGGSALAWPAGARPLAAVALLACAVSAVLLLAPNRVAPDVPRAALRLFPPEIGGWSGSVTALRTATEQNLRADDYINADYLHPRESAPVNLWIAYYREQNGHSTGAIHSPEVCLPGAGWNIVSIDRVEITPQTGGVSSLVYYWFEGRGRRQADELMARLAIKYDALVSGRSDGALVRLVTPILPGELEAAADARLRALLEPILPQLPRFIPA
jgi:exosortase D (VPLPA-CTERM-specific)